VDQAIKAYRKACQLSHDKPLPVGCLGHALAVSGKQRDAQEILKQLLGLAPHPPLDIATVYLGLKEDEEALRWLEVALEHHNLHLLTIPMDRRFSRLRNHPRFQNLLKTMGLGTVGTAA